MIVGLSNPIEDYIDTRHNVGSWFIKILYKKFKIVLKYKKKFFGYIGLCKCVNNNVYFLIPNIYMNLNGTSIYAVASFYKIKIKNILIIQDDLNTFVGKTKFITSYKNYGHNGIKNIISKFENKVAFNRLCIGIGRPKRNVSLSSYVLSKPSKEEKKLIFQSIYSSINIVEKFINKN